MRYECIVCFESLDSLAPTTADAVPEPEQSNSTAISSIRAKARAKKSKKPEDLTENCATYCGHIFHKICLNRWFEQNGKRSCPSCRKPLTLSQVIRLYPPGSPVDKIEAPAETASNRTSVLTEFEERSIPKSNCRQPGCVDFYEVHKTLVEDYNNVRERYADKCDEADFLAAQSASLEEELSRVKTAASSQSQTPSKNKMTKAKTPTNAKKSTKAKQSRPPPKSRTSSDSSPNSSSEEDLSSESEDEPNAKVQKRTGMRLQPRAGKSAAKTRK